MENDWEFTISEAAKKMGITRQAVYLALRKQRLKGYQRSNREWVVTESAIQEYVRSRYSRDISVFNGQPLFDVKNGTYSVKLAAKFLGVSQQRIYYVTRMGYLPCVRKGAAYVMKEEDLIKYKKLYETPKDHKVG